ncbi:MAG: AI-2E family transporter [Erysipelotrichaceae bacterium]
MFKEIFKKIDESLTLQFLIKVICFLIIFLLIVSTYSVWGSWLDIIRQIITPFAIGFGLAYIIHPIIEWLESKGIKKHIAIFSFVIIVITGIVVLVCVLVPMIYDKAVAFMSSMIFGVEWLFEKISEMGGNQAEQISILDELSKSVTDALNSYQNWLPGLTKAIPDMLTYLLNVLTNSIFSIIVAIYVLFDYQKMKNKARDILIRLFPNVGDYLSDMDDSLIEYLKALLILMAIKAVEYCLFYFLVGHQDWLILGIITSIGLIIPYVGPTIANIIGIITAISLSPIRLWIVIIGMLVLPNVDSYLVVPFVHKKRNALGPLFTLFAVFCGGVLAGGIGIIISIPAAVLIKSIYDTYKLKHA